MGRKPLALVKFTPPLTNVHIHVCLINSPQTIKLIKIFIKIR